MKSQIEIIIDRKINSVRSKLINCMETVVSDYAKEVIAEKVDEIVYSYDASPFFKASRMKMDGGLQDPKNMTSSVSSYGNTIKLTVESDVPLQNLFYSDGASVDNSNSAIIVENGLEEYHQPYPREYHEAAEQELLTNGKVIELLQSSIY